MMKYSLRKTACAAVTALFFLLCAFFSFLWTRIRRTEGTARQVRIRIEAAGEGAEFTGLCDTGSRAAEPIGGLPAILVKRRAVPGLSALLDRSPCLPQPRTENLKEGLLSFGKPLVM